jgi:hypothetical protein
MSESKKWWEGCRDWYSRLSPRGRWACWVGLAVLGLAVIRAGTTGPSGPAGGYPAGGQPYGPYPVAPAAYGPPGPGHPGEFHGRISSGTMDRSGRGNHVISVDGRVLTLP